MQLPQVLLLLLSSFAFSYTSAQNITGFTLINAATDQDIGALEDGGIINLSEVGTNLNVRAEVDGEIGSMRFALDGNNNFQTENLAPYALAGNTDNDYNSWTPELGEHTLTTTIFSGANANGEELDQVTINFTVVEDTQEIVLPEDPGTGAVNISGELKKWHKITIDFDGPFYQEEDTYPNPFMDYRMNVFFTNGARTLLVPGYFAADGNAAETSAQSGNVWRVHFAPDEVGEWTYAVSFRIGDQLAVSDDAEAGVSIPPLDGATGSFIVTATDKVAPDNRARGRLQYVGEHYLQYAETGEYFLKGGADAPENFLAYDDFDNTPNNGNRRKSWSPHADDWQTGDPTWQNGKGTEIIGAVNYLASKGVNVFSFLTMNIQGDDRNVFPYLEDTNFEHFDCSKLAQWEIVLAHADQLGMYLHFKTQETENDQLLDGGAVELHRKLYYRELLARFGHHLALNWNMGEENTQTPAQRLEMAQWWADHDPYQHHRVIHTYPNQTDAVYNLLLGGLSEYTGVSIQTNWNNVHDETAKWVANSANSGRLWVVANDEQGNANTGVPPDPGYPGYNGSTPDLNDIRREVLWGNLMAGGAGVEYYFGYQQPESDLSLQDFRSRDQSWIYVNYALQFFRALPFTEMQAADELTPNAWCFAKLDEEYVIYLKNGGDANLQLSSEDDFSVRWYNPRTGVFEDGAILTVSGGLGFVHLGTPLSEPNEDWVIHVERIPNMAPVADFTLTPTSGVAPLVVNFNASIASDPDGDIVEYHWDFGDGETTTGFIIATSHEYISAGTYMITLTITDDDGSTSTVTKTLVVNMSTDTEYITNEGVVRLYPNPAREAVTISWPKGGQANLRLLSLNGQELARYRIGSGDTISVSSFEVETILLELTGDDWESKTILLKEK